MYSMDSGEEAENKNEETEEENLDDDEAYKKKLAEMQNYLPFLEMMIQKLENSKKDNDFREAQMLKIRSLHRILFTSKRRLKMETLKKCEAVLRNLQGKLKEKGNERSVSEAREDMSTKDDSVNADSDYRVIKLQPNGNITIDTPNNDVLVDTDPRDINSNCSRSVLLGERGRMTISRFEPVTKMIPLENRKINAMEHDNRNLDDNANKHNEVGFQEQGQFRSSTIPSFYVQQIGVGSKFKSQKPQGNERLVTFYKRQPNRIPSLLDGIKRDNSVVDKMNKNKRRQDWDLRERLKATDLRERINTPDLRQCINSPDLRERITDLRERINSPDLRECINSPDLRERLSASHKSSYISKKEINYQQFNLPEHQQFSFPECQQFSSPEYQQFNSPEYLWEDNKDLEGSRRRLKSLIGHQHSPLDHEENNVVPELSTEGLLIINHKPRFANYRRKSLIDSQNAVDETENTYTSKPSIEFPHTLSDGNESLSVRSANENKPDQEIQLRDSKIDISSEKHRTVLDEDQGIPAEDKLMSHSTQMCNVNVPKRVGGKSDNKEVTPQQSLRAKLKEEISTVHKVGAACGGALRGLIKKDDKSLSTSRIMSLKAGTLIDLLGNDKSASQKPYRPKVIRDRHRVQEGRTNDSEKQAKTTASCSVSSFHTQHATTSPNKSTSSLESDPSTIINNLSQDDLQKIVTENLKNLPAPHPAILESVRAKTQDIIQKQIVSKDVARCIPSTTDSTLFHSKHQPQNIYHSNTGNACQQEVDRCRSLSQEVSSNSSYIIQQQTQPQNSVNPKGVFTLPLMPRQSIVLNPASVSTDMPYQFSSPQQQQQVHSMNVQRSLFIPRQGIVSGHQQTQNIQQQPSKIFNVTTSQQIPTQLHNIPTAPLLHPSPLQSPPTHSGYSNQTSENWATKFDHDRRNTNTFHRRPEAHITIADSYKWGHHGNQPNYVDSSSVQSSHGYFNTNKQTNIHQPQPSGSGVEIRLSCDQRNATSLHRGLSARDPRRRSIEETLSPSKPANRTPSRSEQNRGRDPRLLSVKYNKDVALSERDPRIKAVDPRIKTVNIKAKHIMTPTKTKPRSNIADKAKERAVSSPLEKLYSTNIKEITGKGYGPQRYKIPKIKRVEETIQHHQDTKDKPPSYRSEEKPEVDKLHAHKFSDSVSRKSPKVDTKEDGECRSTSTLGSSRIRKSHTELQEDLACVKSEEESSSEEEIENSKANETVEASVHETKKYKRIIAYKKKYKERPSVLDRTTDSHLKTEGKATLDNLKTDKPDVHVGNINAAKSNTKDDNSKRAKPNTEIDKTAKPDTKDEKFAMPDTKEEKTINVGIQADKTDKPDIKNGKTAEIDTKDVDLVTTKPDTDTEYFKTGKLDTNSDIKTTETDSQEHNFKPDDPDVKKNDPETVKHGTEEDNFEECKSDMKDICNRSDIIETLISDKSLESDERKKLLKKLEETLPDKKFKKILKIIENSSDDESNGDETITVEVKTIKVEEVTETVNSKSGEDDKKSITDISEENRFEDSKSHDESGKDESVKEIVSKKIKKCTKKKTVKTDKKPVDDTINSKISQETGGTEDIASNKIVEANACDILDKPKRKQKNELEKLQEDIRDMFISKGVVTATGMRMCRLQKETSSAVSNTSMSSASGKELLTPNLRSNKQCKLERQKGVKEAKNDKEKVDSFCDKNIDNNTSEYDTSDDELLETTHKNLKRTHAIDVTDGTGVLDKEVGTFVNDDKPDCKDSEINTSLKVPENIGSPRIILKKTDLSKLGNLNSPDAENSVKHISAEESQRPFTPGKPVGRSKILKGRRKTNWKLGVLQKKMKSKTKLKTKVTDKTGSTNLEMKEENAGRYVDYLDVHYYQGKLKRYNCKLCSYEGKAIVHHYLVGHPSEEVLISRLSPESAADAIKGSVCYDDAVKLSEKFQCRMCARNFPSISSFYEHMTMHTGEYRHECLKCGYRTSTRKGMRYHMKTTHPETRKGEINFQILHEVSAKAKVVVGYLCSGCNFIQLRENNVKKHIKDKHFDKDSKVVVINLSKQKMRDDQLQDSDSIDGDEMFEIKEEILEEVRVDDDAEINIMNLSDSCIEEAEVSVRNETNGHEGDLSNTNESIDVSCHMGDTYKHMQQHIHNQEGNGDDRIVENDNEQGWCSFEIKKELGLKIIDVRTKNSPTSSSDNMNSESVGQEEILQTSSSKGEFPENADINVNQASVFLSSEDFSRYEDNVRLERELTMQEIARNLSPNDNRDSRIAILDQVLEKLNTRHKECVEECSENMEVVTAVEESNTNKQPDKIPSPIVEDEDQSSEQSDDVPEQSDNVPIRRSLPERSCKEKVSKGTEKNCHNEIDPLGDIMDLSDYKEYLLDKGTIAESEIEIVDVREVTASLDNTVTEEESRKNLCLKNTVSQLTETLKTSKAREFLLDGEVSDAGELWLFKVKLLSNNSWKLVMDEIKYILSSADFRSASGCTSSVSLVVGPLESYCLNECWFFKCNVQNCSFTTSVPISFAEHIECNHICTTWNGICALCKVIYHVEGEIKSSYHLASAFLHLLKRHFLELKTLVDEFQKKTKDSIEANETVKDTAERLSTETKSGSTPVDQESAHIIPQQVNVQPSPGPILRVRRLSGDKLSVTPAEKMKKAVDEGTVIGQVECTPAASKEVGGFLRIENVVSLNPSASQEISSENKVQQSDVPSTASSTNTTFVTTDSPTKVQTAGSSRTVRVLSTKSIFKPFNLPTNQNITKPLPVNQILVPRLIRPNLNSTLPPNTQFVSSNSLLGCKILNMKVPRGVDIGSPGQIICPIVTAVTTSHLPPSKTSQPSVNTLSPQQFQAVLQCVQQQQIDQISNKNPNVTVPARKSLVNKRKSMATRDFTDDISKTILQYKDLAAYKEMLLFKNVCRFYKCMAHDCSFSSLCGKAFVTHLENHKAMDERAGVPGDKKHWAKCAYCFKTFQGSKEFCIHLRKEHGQSNIQCAYCFYRSASVANVVFHQKAHHKTESFSLLKCPMSDNIPPRTMGLNIHAFVKPLMCAQGQCMYRTYLFDAFDSHLKTQHKQASFFACYVCKLQTIGTSLLFRHFKELHRFNEFQCLHCMFGADTEDAVRQHLCIIHTDVLPAAVARVKTSNESGYDRAENLKRLVFNEEIDKKCIRSPPPPLEDMNCDTPQVHSVPQKTAVPQKVVVPLKTVSPKKAAVPVNKVVPLNAVSSKKSFAPRKPMLPQKIVLAEDDLPVSKGNSDTYDNGHGSDSPLTTETVAHRTTNKTSITNVNSDELHNQQITVMSISSTSNVHVEPSTEVKVAGEITAKSGPSKSCESVIAADESTSTEKLKQTMTRTKTYVTGLKGMDLYCCAYEGCNYRGIDSAELKSHFQTCERALYASVLRCAHCPKILKHSQNLMEHLRTHGPLRYMCSLCEFKDSVQSRIATHMKQVHKVSSTNIVPANAENKNSENAQFVLVPKEKGAQKPLLQPKKENSRIKAEYSPDEVNELPLAPVFPKPLKCSRCKYSSKVRTNLMIHLNLHLDSAAQECDVPDAEVVNPVPCLEKDEMMFDKMMNLASSSHKNVPKVAKTDEKTDGEVNHLPAYVPINERYVCSLIDCTYVTISESMLRYHIRSLHNNQSHYRCPHCPENSSFVVPIDRIGAHMKLHDSQLFKCSHCAYYHYTRHVVERHVTEKHPEKRPFVIVVRDKDPDAESSSETDTKEGSPSAQQTAEGVVRSGSKQIHCKLCKFRASNEEDMKTHCGNVHGIKSQFKCGLCAFTSDNDSDFDAHFAEKHDKLPTQIVSLYGKVEEIPLIPISSDGLCEASTSAALFGDSTPLWQRGGNKVRHIRGIFIDEEGTAQAPIATPTLEQITNMDPEDGRFPPHGYPAPGSYYVCPLCAKYKTKDPVAMKTHLCKEQNYKPWLCTICGQTSLTRVLAVKHVSKAHVRETKDILPDALVTYCEEADCEKWVNGVLETQLNLMVSVNDNGNPKLGEDIHKPAKKTASRKRRTVSSENMNEEGLSKPTKAKRPKTAPKMKKSEFIITKGRYCCSYCTLSTDFRAVLKLHHNKMHKGLTMVEEGVVAKDPLEGPSTYLDSNEPASARTLKAPTHRNKFTRCVYCNFIAFSITVQKNHWKSTHKCKQYSEGNIVKLNTGVRFSYKTYFFDSDKPYECRWCKVTGIMTDLAEHHLRAHPEQQFHVYSIPKYKCSECCEVCFSVNEITKHFTEVHGKEAARFVLDDQDFTQSDYMHPTLLFRDKTYQCPLCMGTFNSHTRIFSHIKTHGVVHKCFYCDEDFMDLADGHCHMASKHQGLEPQFNVDKLSNRDMQIIKESILITISHNKNDHTNSQNKKTEQSSNTVPEKHLEGSKHHLLSSSIGPLPRRIKQTARKSTTPYPKKHIQSITFWPEIGGSMSASKEDIILPDNDSIKDPLAVDSEFQQSLVTIELSDSDENPV